MPFDRIQGGFEFYGWYRFDKNSVMEWWQKHYDYIVSFDHHEGYQVIKKQPVSWWLPWQRGDILVEEANPGAG